MPEQQGNWFDASTDTSTPFLDLSGGFDIFAREHAALRVGAFISLSDDDNIYGGSFGLETPF